MIWFGNLNRILPVQEPDAFGPSSEEERMQRALEWAAERAPHLGGAALIDALAASGWVARDTAARLLPAFRHFDPDRHFAEHLRRLSFRGRPAMADFQAGVRCIVEEITGPAEIEQVGPESVIRFRCGGREGVVLAQPEVSFSIAGGTRDAVELTMGEMPDALVVVARNFDRGAAAQLSGLLHRSDVPGTLITLNLLLGIRAITLRYQPARERVIQLLGSGRPLRSADIARLGDRVA